MFVYNNDMQKLCIRGQAKLSKITSLSKNYRITCTIKLAHNEF